MRRGDRQFFRDISRANDTYTAAKSWEFPVVTIDGSNVATDIATNTTAITTEKNRLDTLIDSGTTLDTITELKTAWEGGDSTLSTTVNTLVATAATDRALIRTEFAAADSTQDTAITSVQTDLNALKPVRVYYVDAGRTDSYTETGSFKSPFKTLTTAMGRGAGTPELLEDSSTATVVFKLAPGEYTGAISITKASQNQTIEFHGSGAGVTNIQASAAWDATAGNVLYLQKFSRIVIQDCTVRNGAYGCYFRDVDGVEIKDCEFTHLGSSGTGHAFTVTKAQQAAYWAARGTAGADRSDGGATRIRTCNKIVIRGCTISQTLRGMRIQDCAEGRVSDCSARSTLESGFYLAAGSYSGASGCTLC